MEQTKTAPSIAANQEEIPRLAPIENPKSFKLKLVYWLSKKMFGKILTPLKVSQTRMPSTISLSQKMLRVEKNLSLPKDLTFYIKSYVATLNGCTFCIDIAKAAAENEFAVQKYEQLLRYESSNIFSEAEKAALKYVEQATLEKNVTDEVFDKLQRHFDDEEIVEITWLNALENYYNLLNKPLNIGSDNLCSV